MGVDDVVVDGIEVVLERYVRDEPRKNCDSVVTVLIGEWEVTSESLFADGIVVSTVKLINCDTIGTPTKISLKFQVFNNLMRECRSIFNI